MKVLDSLLSLTTAALLTACQSNSTATTAPAADPGSNLVRADSSASLAVELQDVFQADTIWNGVAVADDGRAFVLFPHNEGSAGTRIGEMKGGRAVPYPTQRWNNWQPGAEARQKFVRTNSLRFGPDGYLWIVDTGTPKTGAAPVPDGPKLLAFDITTNKLVRSIALDAYVKPNSFVDDVRVHGNCSTSPTPAPRPSSCSTKPLAGAAGCSKTIPARPSAAPSTARARNW